MSRDQLGLKIIWYSLCSTDVSWEVVRSQKHWAWNMCWGRCSMHDPWLLFRAVILTTFNLSLANSRSAQRPGWLRSHTGFKCVLQSCRGHEECSGPLLQQTLLLLFLSFGVSDSVSFSLCFSHLTLFVRVCVCWSRRWGRSCCLKLVYEYYWYRQKSYKKSQIMEMKTGWYIQRLNWREVKEVL